VRFSRDNQVTAIEVTEISPTPYEQVRRAIFGHFNKADRPATVRFARRKYTIPLSGVSAADAEYAAQLYLSGLSATWKVVQVPL
jgi:hypothetical protein